MDAGPLGRDNGKVFSNWPTSAWVYNRVNLAGNVLVRNRIVLSSLLLLWSSAVSAQGARPTMVSLGSMMVEGTLGGRTLAASDASEDTRDFSLLSYNVAGIPTFSAVRPDLSAPQIGPLLNDYDLVLLQEDFAFHETLSHPSTHPFRSQPRRGRVFFGLGDGLNRFSRFPFSRVTRIPWSTCSGIVGRMFDCIAIKGHAVATTWLSDGIPVDVYNIHLDAGSGARDQTARTIQIDELIASVRDRSNGRAVIIAGDTNLQPTQEDSDASNLDRLIAELDLIDVCEELHCDHERVDRILYRSGGGISMRAVEYQLPEEFVDAEGTPLSDHHPVAVRFEWEATLNWVAE